jgi:glutathione peroxidase
MAEATRRAVLLGAGALAVSAAAPPPLAWDFTFTSIEDGTLPLAQFKGRALLVVNTASFCGFTYQYKGLEALHTQLSPKGLTVVGVPSQDFDQESDSNAKVKQFCEGIYGIQFPLAGLTHVKGAQAHPFYRWVHDTKDWEPAWNFNKVLIGRDGRIAGLFSSWSAPDGVKLRGAIGQALDATA